MPSDHPSGIASPTLSPVVLHDGAVLRGARAEDVPEMLAIESDREGDDDAVDLELVANTPGGLDSMSVVELDGQVVSIATLLDETLRVGGVPLRAGQVEMVATRRDAEGRGYVRALMGRCHDLSAARGHVMQVMIGIPNFYRQFGYSYSIPMHPWATVTRRDPQELDVGGFGAAAASEADASDCRGVQDAAQRQFDVSMPHSDECWGWLLRHTSSRQVLVRDASGRPSALARVYDDGEGSVDVGEFASVSTEATHALLADVLRSAGPEGTVRVSVRPHVPALAEATADAERPDWYYTRIADPALLLSAMAPDLLRRLRDGGHDQGDALISFFRRHVRLAWTPEELTVAPGGPLQAPVYAGGSGVPSDALGSMLFGGGAESLEDRFPDAHLGRQADLMTLMFPAVSADLLTFYLPS
jgi:predicted N-acetyltransferase YhbS